MTTTAVQAREAPEGTLQEKLKISLTQNFLLLTHFLRKRKWKWRESEESAQGKNSAILR